MNVLKLLLYPFAALYNGVMRLRNHLYDIGQKPSFEFGTTVIAVGNLNVGGSGKTPMVEYLIELIGADHPTVTLSRGYRRETAGYRVATSDDTAGTIGDEPLQLFRKYAHRIRVAVGEDRVYAIPQILQEYPETEVIVLDDAMQQRSIQPSLSILLTTADHPFYKDFLLPFGRLRESRAGASRADVVVVTKCDPGEDAGTCDEMAANVRKYTGKKPVFFSTIEYGDPTPVRSGSVGRNVVLVTGIANADALRRHCDAKFELIRHFQFVDHHRYTEKDLEEIDRFCASKGEDVCVLTTEKDLAKLDCPGFATFINRRNWFSLPIRQVFLRDGAKFDALVLNALSRPRTP